MDGDQRTALLAAARSGDQRAFGILIDTVTVRLSIFLRRNGGRALGADCDADDLFQETTVRAWSLLERFEDRGPDSFYRWVVALAKGIISNRLKYVDSRGRGDVRHVESVVEGGADRGAFDSKTSLASLVARRDEIRQLDRAMGRLDDASRQLVERSVLEGATISELAQETGLARTTVWNQLASALSEIKRSTGEAGRD